MTHFLEDFSTDDLSRYYHGDIPITWTVGGGVLTSSVGGAETSLVAAIGDVSTGDLTGPAAYADALTAGLETLKVVEFAPVVASIVTLQLWVTDAAREGWPYWDALCYMGLQWDTGGQYALTGYMGANLETAVGVTPTFPCWLALRINTDGSGSFELWEEDPWTSTGSPVAQVTDPNPFLGRGAPPMVPALDLHDEGGGVGGMVVDDWNWGPYPVSGPPPPPPPTSVNGNIAAGNHTVGYVKHVKH